MTPDDDRSAGNEVVSDVSQTTHLAPRGKTTETTETWGRYRLVRRLGAGGFGSVYCAWDPQLERNIAIKILHEQVADDRLQERLLLEGRALARVQHANVVQVFEVAAHGSRVGLCMELVSGETLSDVLRSRGPMNPREAAVVGEDVCRALAAVHAAGYVHRDVKAQNVMRDKAGKIVLMDFGTGHDATSDSHGPRDFAGTPVYMAPELLDGHPASVQSDIYAVGVLLYHLVTRQYPVEGATLLDLIDAHKTGRGRPLVERRPDVPLPFAQVVSRAIAVNPAERWESAEAMLQALSELRGGSFHWARAIQRVVAVILGGAIGLTALGTLTSRYFNVVLGREAFVSEGLGDWLYWGAVSAVAPAVLALMALVGLAVLRVTLRALLWLWPGGRRIGDVLSIAIHRLGLDNLDTISAGALVTSVAVLAIPCGLLYADLAILLSLIGSGATAPIEDLAYLSPANGAQHDNYRLSFEWTCIILVALLRVPFKMAANRGLRVNGGLQIGAAAVLLLALLLLDFPYRLMYQADFDAVEWRGRQCALLGERDDDYLVFCLEMEPPRSRVVRKDAGDLVHLGTKMNPFDNAPAPPP